MKEQHRNNHTDGVLVLVLFGVFALCVLSSLLQGAGIYHRMTLRGQEAYDRRTAAQYLIMRVHQSDRRDGVRVAQFDTVEALELSRTVDNTEYVTRIYCYDGNLCELFSARDSGVSPEDGEAIMPVQKLNFSLEKGLLTAELLQDGQESQIKVRLRSAGGGAP